MLPQSDRQTRINSEGDKSDPALLQRFRADNPQLIPVDWDGRGTLCDQFWHFAFLRHREHSSGMEPECCYSKPLKNCITDHSELWQDRETQDLIHIAHPYCDGTDEGYKEGVEFLRKRGLNTAMTEASWYYPGRTNLVVVARPRTFGRIALSELLHLDNWTQERETEKIVAMQEAREQVEVDHHLADAEAAEASGNYAYAALLYLDTAHTERTGRFHRSATQCLRQTARLLHSHYSEVVMNVATRGLLTHAEVRKVFRFAGIEVPPWLERIWRNGRRSESWSFRMERNEADSRWVEYRRCVVCEQWMKEGESVYDFNLGSRHLNSECLARVAGVPVEQLSERG